MGETRSERALRDRFSEEDERMERECDVFETDEMHGMKGLEI